MNQREQTVQEARKLISDGLLVDFFRQIKDSGNVFAVELLNQDLDSGLSLDQIFYTGDNNGFSLSVSRVGDNEMKLCFSCHAGPLAGDGGEWIVCLDESERIVSIEQTGEWIE